MRSACLFALMAVAAAVPALAQTSDEPRMTIGAVAGAGRTWDDESDIGRGFVAGARIERRLFGQTRVEVGADILGHDRSGGAFEAEGRTGIVTISVVQRFGGMAAQPYLLAGLAIARHSGSTTFQGDRRERSSTDTGLTLGAGLAVRIGSRMEIGPEARAFSMQASDDSNPALAYWVGVRFAYRF